MSLTNFDFFIFFSVVYVLLWCIKLTVFKRSALFQKMNIIILLLASFLFVGLLDWRFCASLAVITIVVYITAIYTEKLHDSGKSAKCIFIVGLSIVLLQLGIFKYFDFFASSISNLLGADYVTVNIIIPIGISFYSFSAISYISDVYRKKYKAVHSFFKVALFVSFFPKLTSGPIVRADRFFLQLGKLNCVSLKNLEIGVQIVTIGLFKKMVVADHLSIFVNQVFNTPNAFTGATCLLAMVSYSLQIYFDFSGYSDIAIGFSKILGFNFDKNFDLPYISKNPTEFWKRWHISFSSWLQEYLYYPLGGNRKGKIRTYINLLLTMLIGGLWHGASWTFIIWGGIHGIALIAHKLFCKWRIRFFGNSSRESIIGRVISIILMFFFISMCWVFFRANSLQNAFDMFEIVFFGNDGISQMFSWSFFAMIMLILEIAVAYFRSKKSNRKLQAEYFMLDLTKLWSLVVFFTFLGFTLILAYMGNTAFIYGNF